MKLSECTHGIIVYTKWGLSSSVTKVGMVVGITSNAPASDISISSELERAIPLVKFSGETAPRGVHHGNLYKYED